MEAFVLSRIAQKFPKRSVDKFQGLACMFSNSLGNIMSVDDFDAYHLEFMTAFRQNIQGE